MFMLCMAHLGMHDKVAVMLRVTRPDVRDEITFVSTSILTVWAQIGFLSSVFSNVYGEFRLADSLISTNPTQKFPSTTFLGQLAS